MLVVLARKPAERVVFPNELWKALALASAAAPALNQEIEDASPRSRGAKDGQTASNARRNGVPRTWSLGFNMKGWHGRGRVLRHLHDDYGALLPVAIHQGVALYEVAKEGLQD